MSQFFMRTFFIVGGLFHGLWIFFFSLKSRTFGLGSWAVKFWGIWGIFGKIISTQFGTVPKCIYNPNRAMAFSAVFTFQLDNTKR